MERDCVIWLVELDKKDIAYIASLFETYDDFGVVRTLDASKGHIEIMISPDYVEEVRKLLQSLAHEIPHRILRGQVSA